MNVVYVPFCGRDIATIDVKGQRIVVLATEPDTLEDDLELLGADHLEELVDSNSDNCDDLFENLANQVQGNLVVVPCDVELNDVLSSLNEQYEWLN